MMAARNSNRAVEAARLALRQIWVRDRGAFDFLRSAGYSEARIKELVSELLTVSGKGGVTTRGVPPIGNTVEKAAILVLAGAHSADWVWKYAAQVYRRDVAIRDKTEKRDELPKLKFFYAASRVIGCAEASGETLSRETLCKRAIGRDSSLGVRGLASLAKWAKEEFPEIRSARGRKPKAT